MNNENYIKVLLDFVTNKNNFKSVNDYMEFCKRYVEFIEKNHQAIIIAQNETNYRFFQYKEGGQFNITRPINSDRFFSADSLSENLEKFKLIFNFLRKNERPAENLREVLINTIYTLQQSVGAMLDALPSGESNKARKLNGDLFERLIVFLVFELGIHCTSGNMKVPIKDADGNILLKNSYQHDLLISNNNELKVIGSVKTSSKDRIDKVFMDKFLFCKLTETDLPHIAIFLNDVQRKKSRLQNRYNINSTFLPGHFKAFTIKLNALDGVYYCDVRPNMVEDEFLSSHIKTIDHFFFTDLFDFIEKPGIDLNYLITSRNNKR